MSSFDEKHVHPPTSSHHCHHLAHAAFRLHHICCVLLGGACHAAAPVGGSEPTTVGPRTSKALGRGPFRPVAHPRRLVQTGARAPLVAGVGRFLGLGLSRESLDLGRLEWRSMVVERTPLVVTGAYRPVPPKRGQQQLGGQGPSHFVRRPCARGHGHPPLDGLDPLEFSAPTTHHHDLGQAGYGTHVVKKRLFVSIACVLPLDPVRIPAIQTSTTCTIPPTTIPRI